MAGLRSFGPRLQALVKSEAFRLEASLCGQGRFGSRTVFVGAIFSFTYKTTSGGYRLKITEQDTKGCPVGSWMRHHLIRQTRIPYNLRNTMRETLLQSRQNHRCRLIDMSLSRAA